MPGRAGHDGSVGAALVCGHGIGQPIPMSIRPSLLGAVLAAFAATGATTARSAEPATAGFFDAALCKPPYSYDSATDLYQAAEKLTKPNMSNMGAAIYHLPAPIARDGFVTQDVVFAGSSVGVLVEGEVAAKLAERYDLAPEKSHLLGASSLGFSRLLLNPEQGMKELGLISVVARQGPSLHGKTLLACAFVSDEDRKGLEEMERLSQQP